LKIVFDTNIILDVLLNREPFVELSANLLSTVENKKIEGYLCATTITTLDYLISKETNRNKAKIEMRKLLNLFKISEVNSKVLELSINSEFKDFEDAVQYYSGECSRVNGLVTRNTKDYKQAKLPIYTPDELWGIISINHHKKA
jgi:predicted nucleic acid-binding protein